MPTQLDVQALNVVAGDDMNEILPYRHSSKVPQSNGYQWLTRVRRSGFQNHGAKKIFFSHEISV